MVSGPTAHVTLSGNLTQEAVRKHSTLAAERDVHLLMVLKAEVSGAALRQGPYGWHTWTSCCVVGRWQAMGGDTNLVSGLQPYNL